MRRYFLLMGALVLMLAMVAACGDDDDGDDSDIADDVTVTMPDTDDEATEDDADVTATTDDGEATGTEADADVTGTESDGAAGTMDADATGTDDDADGGTETDDATGTEDDDADDGTEAGDDATGTADDSMDDATGTEDDDADATGTDDDSAEATAGDDGGIGEPVTIGDFILTVNDVMVLDSGGVVAPDEGNQFLGVEMTVENTGPDAIGLSRALMMTRLEDADGQHYEIDLAATAIAIFSGGFDPATEIGPGSEITGVAGFQVPDDLSPDDLTLVIEPDTGERVEIPLDDNTP